MIGMVGRVVEPVEAFLLNITAVTEAFLHHDQERRAQCPHFIMHVPHLDYHGRLRSSPSAAPCPLYMNPGNGAAG